MRQHRLFISASFALCSLVLACGGAETTAPVISDLSYSPTSVAIGTPQRIDAQVLFEDPDADVLEVVVTLRTEAGADLAQSTIPVSASSGLVRGSVSLSLMVALPGAGRYELRIALRDSEGNTSNELVGSIEAS